MNVSTIIHSRLTNEADKLTNEADKLTNEADNKCCQPECFLHSPLFGCVVSQVASGRLSALLFVSGLSRPDADAARAALVTQTPPTPQCLFVLLPSQSSFKPED